MISLKIGDKILLINLSHLFFLLNFLLIKMIDGIITEIQEKDMEKEEGSNIENKFIIIIKLLFLKKFLFEYYFLC